MWLLKIICPKVIPNRKTNWGYRVRFYHWSLLRLMPLYKRCAMSNTIQMGDVQVVHNIRDYWYEQELQRFHIDIAQHIEKVETPMILKRRYKRSELFNWTESIIVYANAKSYSILQSNSFAIQTDMSGVLKLSSAKDFILRSEFIAKTGKQIPPIREQSATQTTHLNPSPSHRGTKYKISIKDAIPAPTDTTPLVNAEENPQQYTTPLAKTTQFRGFEENELF